MGRIEVIYGCMFSGKTTELIRRLERAEIAGKKVVAFKPMVDNRHGNGITTHRDSGCECITITGADEIIKNVNDHDVVGIDEIQFFDGGIINVCKKLRQLGKQVIVAGLSTDYLGRPFTFKDSRSSIGDIILIADRADMLNAVCTTCGSEAIYTEKLRSGKTIEVGGKEIYTAKCHRHHSIPHDKG